MRALAILFCILLASCDSGTTSYQMMDMSKDETENYYSYIDGEQYVSRLYKGSAELALLAAKRAQKKELDIETAKDLAENYVRERFGVEQYQVDRVEYKHQDNDSFIYVVKIYSSKYADDVTAQVVILPDETVLSIERNN